MVTLKKKDGDDGQRIARSPQRCRPAIRGDVRHGSGGDGHRRAPSDDSSARVHDESVRTEAREVAPTRPTARTSYRTTARTTARTAVGSSGSRGTSAGGRRRGRGYRRGGAPGLLPQCGSGKSSGSIVDVETQVENDRVVLDRILTFTDGFVESSRNWSRYMSRTVWSTAASWRRSGATACCWRAIEPNRCPWMRADCTPR